MYTSLQIHRCLVKEKINEERGTSTSEHYSNLAAFVVCCFFFQIFLFPNIFSSMDACMSDQQFINPLTRVCENGYI